MIDRLVDRAHVPIGHAAHLAWKLPGYLSTLCARHHDAVVQATAGARRPAHRPGRLRPAPPAPGPARPRAAASRDRAEPPRPGRRRLPPARPRHPGQRAGRALRGVARTGGRSNRAPVGARGRRAGVAHGLRRRPLTPPSPRWRGARANGQRESPLCNTATAQHAPSGGSLLPLAVPPPVPPRRSPAAPPRGPPPPAARGSPTRAASCRSRFPHPCRLLPLAVPPPVPPPAARGSHAARGSPSPAVCRGRGRGEGPAVASRITWLPAAGAGNHARGAGGCATIAGLTPSSPPSSPLPSAGTACAMSPCHEDEDQPQARRPPALHGSHPGVPGAAAEPAGRRLAAPVVRRRGDRGGDLRGAGRGRPAPHQRRRDRPRPGLGRLSARPAGRSGGRAAGVRPPAGPAHRARALRRRLPRDAAGGGRPVALDGRGAGAAAVGAGARGGVDVRRGDGPRA